MQWLSFLLLLSAVASRGWFSFSSGGSSYTVGLWTVCERSRWSWSTYCYPLSYRTLLDVSDLDLFQSLRAFVVMSLLFATTSAILASVRLARHQRQQPISNRMEWAIHAAGLTTLLCLLVAFITSFLAWRHFSLPYSYGGDGRPVEGFALLMTAFALMLLAVPTHAITLLLYKRTTLSANAGSGADKTGVPLMDAANQPGSAEGVAPPTAAASPAPFSPPAYASSFPHPAPYYVAAQYRPHQLPMSVGYQPPTATAPFMTSTATPQW